MDVSTPGAGGAWTPAAIGLFGAAAVFALLTGLSIWMLNAGETGYTWLNDHLDCPMPGWVNVAGSAGVIGILVGIVCFLWGIVRVVRHGRTRTSRTVEGVGLIVLGAVLAMWGFLTAGVMFDTAMYCVD